MNDSWNYIPFSDAVEICDSQRKPINRKDRAARIEGKSIEQLYPYYGAAGQVGYIDDFITDGEYVLLGEDGAPFLDASANKAYIIKGKTWVNNHAHVLKSKTNNQFLCHYLNHFNFKGFVSGTTRLKLTQADMKRIPVPNPDAKEQRRIVTKIEELFSELDKGVETLQIIKQQLEVYRQAVLKEAFEGIKKCTVLESLADMIDPQPSHRTPPEVIGGIPYIGIGDIDYKEKKPNFSDAREVSPSVLQEHLERYTLHYGDFVMGKIGTIGKPFRITLPQNYALSANVILIQPNNKVIVPEFLFWQFSSILVTKQLSEGANATSQPAFGIKKARLLSIKICSIEEQKQIVKQIESRISICDSIEQAVDTALVQADVMRQSILKQAFEGGITE